MLVGGNTCKVEAEPLFWVRGLYHVVLIDDNYIKEHATLTWLEQHKGEWAVMEKGITPIIFEYCKTEEEAIEKARLINKAEEVIDEINTFIDETLEELSTSDREMLKDYLGGKKYVYVFGDHGW